MYRSHIHMDVYLSICECLMQLCGWQWSGRGCGCRREGVGVGMGVFVGSVRQMGLDAMEDTRTQETPARWIHISSTPLTN